MKRKDVNQLAFFVVQQAISETLRPPETKRAKAGRKGGLKGGKARAAALSPATRRKIAKRAASARWHKP
jgi:hypothetical protein